jgi:aminoglycoside 2'-N-acetyltransferase I
VFKMQIEVLDGSNSWPRAEPIFDAIWPPGIRATLPWEQLLFENAPRRVFVSDTGADTSHVGLHVRECLVDGKPLRVGGIGGVLTYAHARRKGYAAAAIRHGLGLFADEGCAFALLCCNDYNYAFYRGLGWRQIDARILIEQPTGKKKMTEMEPFLFDLELSVDPKEIDLCGLPW